MGRPVHFYAPNSAVGAFAMAQWVARYIFIARCFLLLATPADNLGAETSGEEVRLVRWVENCGVTELLFLGENGWRCVNAGSFVIVLYSGSDLL